MRIKTFSRVLAAARHRLTIATVRSVAGTLRAGCSKGFLCALHGLSHRASRLVFVFSAVAICGCSAAHAAVFTDPQWVSFDAAAALPSALAQRVLGDALYAARPTAHLRGLLVVPEGDGPFPAVVMVHGCRGVLPSHRGWAQWLARQGFMVLLVDSFFTRNAINVCSRGPDESASQEMGGRVFDAFGALRYLRADSRVDAQRVAVIGWQSWAPLSAVARAGPRVLVDGAFRAAVAISPQCPLRADESASPVLIVIGAQDQWHSARACQQLRTHSAGTIEVAVLPGAGHGFDEVPARGGQVVASAFNTRLGRSAPLSLRYDGHAHERAAQVILQFLRRELLPGDAASEQQSGLFRLAAGVRWAVDPADPGADRPPRGRSLFDRVFADGKGGHQLPFPFAKVLDTLERAIGAAPGSRDGLASVLIPIGRSLQRSAAAPDFFRFPRLVVAVDGEPVHRPRAHFLKDRLFLGYHEKAQVIEIISYNEEAARFEYQVVDNYAPDGAPQVRYANRALCVSCHQNQAPIFSRAAWDETNANRHTARRLRAQRTQFYGVTVRSGGAPAARVDNATDRANLLPALQFLWRDACGGALAGAAQCRAAALIAMVQYRLSASAGYEREDPMYGSRFAAMFARQWQGLSPHGLAIPEADLLNRDPSLEPAPTEIDAHLDPLTARGPALIWDQEQAMRRLIAELSQSLPMADLGALDAQLSSHTRRANAARRDVALRCTVMAGGRSAQSTLIQVRCADTVHDAQRAATQTAADDRTFNAATDGTSSDSAPLASTVGASASTTGAFSSPALAMELNVAEGRVLDGFVSTVTLPGGDRFERIHASAGPISVDADGVSHVSVQLRQRNGWSVRDHRGHALEQIDLRWALNGAAAAGVHDGSAQMRMVADFEPLRTAVQSMAAAAPGAQEPLGHEVFGIGSFMPTQVLNLVLQRLDPAARQWCCDASELPAIALSVTTAKGAQLTSPMSAEDVVVASFHRHCGTCHASPTQAPPGFLHGSASEVMASLRQCAPRIAFRLRMWLRAADQRIRSPMPPPTILPSRGLDEMSWRNGLAFDGLLRWAQARSGTTAAAASGASAPADLAACLPTSGAAAVSGASTSAQRY